ncbi:MAG: hypothetical protein K2M56_01025 [Muribaculaceae bacterium]|nr:hypothetical protein [Muribaculaceae bacterium]
MLQFTTTTVSTDNPSMLVKNLKTGAVGNQTRPKNSEESDYIEITREAYEQEQRESALREIYVREVNRRMAERYMSQEESAITRKALALVINPQAISNEAEAKKADKVIEEFNEYNAYAEAVKAEVALQAPDIYDAEQAQISDDDESGIAP